LSHQKLHVLQVIPELETGGAERTTLEIAQAVVEAGGRCVVWSAGGRLVPELLSLGAIHIEGKAASKNPWDVFVRHPAQLRDIIKAHDINIVHARSRAPAWSALLAAQQCGTAFVTTYHGIYNATGALKRLYNSVMVRGDAIIANSHFTKDHVVAAHRIDPARIDVIYRGVDLVAFDPNAVSEARKTALAQAWGLGDHGVSSPATAGEVGAKRSEGATVSANTPSGSLRSPAPPLAGEQNVQPPSPRPRVILPARLTAWKGQMVLIEALALLKERGLTAELVLVGDAQGRDQYVARLKEACARLGLTDDVHFVGHCSDMPAAFALCDVAVTPSIEPEAFGRTAIEAQAMGLPVIASDLGGARETVAHGATGLLVPPNDPAALADALQQLLTQGSAARDSMSAAGQARARALFSTQSLQRDTLALYHRVLEARKGTRSEM
jgi:glycosyltransferase involved in cell wall biosynthesis